MKATSTLAQLISKIPYDSRVGIWAHPPFTRDAVARLGVVGTKYGGSGNRGLRFFANGVEIHEYLALVENLTDEDLAEGEFPDDAAALLTEAIDELIDEIEAERIDA